MIPTDTRDAMLALGRRSLSGILGTYESLLGQRHELEDAALRLRGEGESLGSARALTLRQALYDCHRRLHLYSQLALEVSLIEAAGRETKHA